MELRVGIAGAGSMGRAHAEAYARHGVQVAVVADRDPERAQMVAAPFGASGVASLQEMIEAGVNAVSVCLPHNLHLPAVLLCVERRIPLLIEKPHCCSGPEARMIHEACRESGQTPMVGFTHRFLRSTLELERRLRCGEFGSIELVTDCLAAKSLGPSAPAWYGDRDAAGGGITMIGTIHAIDRFRYLLGSEVKAVHAVCREPEDGAVESLAVILLDFASGACGSVAAYRSPAPGHERLHHYRIFGTRGEAECAVDEFSKQRLSIMAGGHTTHVDCDGDEPFTLEIGEFLSSIREGRPPHSGLEDGEMALAIVLAIYESARTGRRVQMEDFMRQHFPWWSESR